jgi:hypothetical protein
MQFHKSDDPRAKKEAPAFSQRLDGQHKEESMTLELLFALLVCPSLPLLFGVFV